jgi:hypothetical protein
MLLKAVDKIADEEKDQKTVSNALQKVCDKLPFAVMEAPCRMLVQSIILNLADTFDSKVACADLGFCTDENVLEERELVMRANEDDMAVANCTACEFSVRSLQTMAAHKETREIGLKQVCDFLPGVPGLVCKAVDSILSNSKKRRDFATERPRDICREAEMCALPTVRSVPSLESLADPKTLCQACEIYMSAFATKIARNDTEQNLTSELQRNCVYLPTMAEECHKVMKEFGPVLVKRAGEALQQTGVCALMGLCQN